MLSRNDILEGLRKLSEIAKEHGKSIDISIYGGSAISLVWEFRVTTKDVDVVVRSAKDKTFIMETAKNIAEEKGWPSDWLNDAVKGFISVNEDLELWQPDWNDENPGIRIFVPTPEYILAMKCMAMRVDQPESSDIEDIKCLIEELNIESSENMFEIVEKFYPKQMIPPKVQFGIEEIVEEILNDRQRQSP